MTDQSATHHTERLKIGHAADVAPMPVQQICGWIMAHKLEAHRVCTGFRIDELGLSEVRPALRSSR